MANCDGPSARTAVRVPDPRRSATAAQRHGLGLRWQNTQSKYPKKCHIIPATFFTLKKCERLLGACKLKREKGKIFCPVDCRMQGTNGEGDCAQDSVAQGQRKFRQNCKQVFEHQEGPQLLVSVLSKFLVNFIQGE